MHPLIARFAAPWLATVILPTMALAADSDTNLQADNPAYSWNLGDLYPSPQAWTIEHDRVLAQAKPARPNLPLELSCRPRRQ
jgi:hypothetical protein